jgi:hypothetical protein
MTRTCMRCDNGRGRVEAEVVDWRDDSSGTPRLPRTRSSVRASCRGCSTVGPRRHVRADRRRAGAPRRRARAEGVGIALQFVPPDPRLVKLAAPEHAYLVACSDLRAIPQTPRADVIRHDRVAAGRPVADGGPRQRARRLGAAHAHARAAASSVGGAGPCHAVGWPGRVVDLAGRDDRGSLAAAGCAAGLLTRSVHRLGRGLTSESGGAPGDLTPPDTLRGVWVVSGHARSVRLSR